MSPIKWGLIGILIALIKAHPNQVKIELSQIKQKYLLTILKKGDGDEDGKDVELFKLLCTYDLTNYLRSKKIYPSGLIVNKEVEEDLKSFLTYKIVISDEKEKIRLTKTKNVFIKTNQFSLEDNNHSKNRKKERKIKQNFHLPFMSNPGAVVTIPHDFTVRVFAGGFDSPQRPFFLNAIEAIRPVMAAKGMDLTLVVEYHYVQEMRLLQWSPDDLVNWLEQSDIFLRGARV
jgi:hypothetical protein